MKTTYIRLVQVAESCAFGPLLVDWIYTHLMRVTRNRLGKEQWEWVATGKRIGDEEMKRLRRQYPLAKYA